MNDIRYALRQLIKSRGFTIVAVLTLALGIGVNTSMFSVLNTLLFRALPYPHSDQLVRVHRTVPQSQSFPHAPANFYDYRSQSESFESMAALIPMNYGVTEPGQMPEQIRGLEVTGDFFKVLGVQSALGRVFGDAEDRPGQNSVVVLSDSFWRRRFAGDPTIVGREIRLDGAPITVIGVMPRSFEDRLLWGQVDAWKPMGLSAEQQQNRGNNWLIVVGRLKPDIGLTQAQSEMGTIAARLSAEYPDSNAQSGLHLVRLVSSATDETARTISWFAMGLAVCVLLIACANLSNLQFARNAARARERAIRAALGSSQMRLMRESLTESLILALVGGALSLLVALWSNQLLGASIDVAGEAGLDLPLDFRALSFAFVASMLTGLGFGLLPALLASRVDLNDALKQQSGRTTASSAQHRVRHGLIVAQVALALVLLCGAGFFLRGLDRFLDRDAGWNTADLLTAQLVLPGTTYPTTESRTAFHDRLLTRLAGIPGVEKVAIAAQLPFSGASGSQRFVIEGQPVPTTGSEPLYDTNPVGIGYFDTLGIELVEGRVFSDADLTVPNRTIIINQAMARRFWPGESPLGKRISSAGENDWQEIIGVVRDVNFAANLGSPDTQFQTYRLLGRDRFVGRGFVVALRCASTLEPESLTGELRNAVAAIDPNQSVEDIRSATVAIERQLTNVSVLGWLLGGFALLGLLLSALGIYGVLAGFVTQRTNEIGIRMALGATFRDVLRLVLGQGLRLALIGVAIGLFGAFAVGRLLSAIVPQLPAAEPATAIEIVIFLIVIALAASLLPALRAARIDPMEALRHE